MSDNTYRQTDCEIVNRIGFARSCLVVSFFSRVFFSCVEKIQVCAFLEGGVSGQAGSGR